MALTVNTNVAALNAYRNLTGTQTTLSRSLEKLSSGYRINRAADDAAGLAISEGLKSQVGGLSVAARNASDGISLVQTAEGALTEVHSILQRLRDLAVQAANDSNNADARTNITTEAHQLTAELNRIGASTNFNGTSLLDGSASTLNFQVGADGTTDSTIGVDLTGADLTAIVGALTGTATPAPATWESAGTWTNAKDGDSLTFTLGAVSHTVTFTADQTDATSVATALTANAAFAADFTATTDAGKLVVTAADPTVAGTIAATWTSATTTGTQSLRLTGLDWTQINASDRLGLTLDGVTTYPLFAARPTSLASVRDLLNADPSFAGTYTASLDGTDLVISTVAATYASGTPISATFADNSKFLSREVTATNWDAAKAGDELMFNLPSDDSPLHTVTLSTDATGVADIVNALNNDPTFASELVASSADGTHLTLKNTVQTSVILFTYANLGGGGVTNAASGTPTDLGGGFDDPLAPATATTGFTPAASTPLTGAPTTTPGGPANAISFLTHADAQAAITTIDDQIRAVSTARATLGAYQNRLEHTINSVDVAIENLTASNSRIRDTDMASEMVAFTRAQILQQAGTAMLAQANTLPQSILKLLG